MTNDSFNIEHSIHFNDDRQEIEQTANKMLWLGGSALGLGALAETISVISSHEVAAQATSTTAMVAGLAGAVFMADGLVDRVRSSRQRHDR